MRLKLQQPPRRPRNPNERGELKWCGDAPREPALALFASDGGALADGDREAMLKAVRAGELVELEMEAVTFIQRDTPNRNYVRFKPAIMAAFAKSFAGQPMLCDHNQWEMSARGGTILSSKLEHADDGSKQIRMRLRLVKPWAVESALDGTLDRFSIGWSRSGPVLCSVCDESLAKCDHWPGDRVGEKVCEAVFTGAVGTEVSGVNVPAVVGTRIESISRLEAIDPGSLADILAEDTTDREPDTMKILPALLAILSLPTTANEDDALKAVEDQADKLKIAEGKLANVSERLTAIEVESKARLAAERKATIDGTIGQLITAGKLKPGSELELALRRQGERDLDVLSATAKDLLAVGATVTPIGAPLPAATKDPVVVPASTAKAYLAETPVTAGWLAKAGITAEQFEKHGGNALAMVATLRDR